MTPAPSKAGRQPAAPQFKLDFGTEPRGLSDRVLFQVLVYWLIGLSASTIARVMLTPRGKVLNAVTKGEYANRAGMSDAQRQALLDDLRDIRYDDGPPIDCGELNHLVWKIQPLSDGRKRRPARKVAAP